MNTYLTIRSAAKTTGYPEHRIRQMVASKRCPGTWSGNRFLVNIEAFAAQLDAESMAAVKQPQPGPFSGGAVADVQSGKEAVASGQTRAGQRG